MAHALAIIMARGGSKRVPRKNVRPFCGKPMIAWPIEVALASKCFSNIIVSTEDAEIASVAQHYGASVPFIRPINLADDFTGTAAVLKHALDTLYEQSKVLPQYTCCMYGTSAMITSYILYEAQEKLQTGMYDMVMAVTEYVHPIERAMFINGKSELVYRQPEFVNQRTQDLPPSCHDIGLFYFFSTRVFLEQGGTSFIPLRKAGIIVPRTFAVDVDTEEDFVLAEALASRHLSGQ